MRNVKLLPQAHARNNNATVTEMV